jgi:hypothetical protein
MDDDDRGRGMVEERTRESDEIQPGMDGHKMCGARYCKRDSGTDWSYVGATTGSLTEHVQ